MAIGLLAVGVLPGPPLLVVAIVLFVTGSGSYDVAINGAAMGSGRWSGPAALTLLHAGFSGGGALGAIAAGAMLGAGTPFAFVYPASAVALAGCRRRRSLGCPPAGGDESVPRAIVLALLPLAGLAGLAFLIEGSMESWSAIYSANPRRRRVRRRAGSGLVPRGDVRRTSRRGRHRGQARERHDHPRGGLDDRRRHGGRAPRRSPPPAVAGMAVAALGASFVVPVVVSLAAVRAGRHAGRAASYVPTLGYAGFLIGPSLVGILGEAAGLRVALAVVPAAAAVIAIASRMPAVTGRLRPSASSRGFAGMARAARGGSTSFGGMLLGYRSCTRT